jgi:TPR repeat protein
MAVRPTQLTAKKSPVALIAIIVVVVAAAAAAGWYFLLRPTPERAVKAYLRAAEAGDTAAMKAMLSADTLKLLNIGGTASANAMKASVPTGATYTLGETKIEGDRATVFVKYAGAAAPSPAQGQDVPFVLVKENGQWKIDLLSTLLMQGLGTAGGDLAADLSNVMRNAFSQPRR